MFFKKAIRPFVFIASILFLAGSLIVPAQAVGTASPMFLSFESDDALGAEVAKPSSPGHLLGSWYDGATTSISTTPPAPHEGQALSFLKAGSAYAWSGFTAFDGGSATIFTDTSHPVITMDYYSSSVTDTPVELKLEVVGNPAKSAYKVVKASPGWNALSFDMSSGAKNWFGTAGYNRMALIPNFGGDQPLAGVNAAVNNGQKYYIDNISINGGTLANVQTGGPTPEASPTASPNKIFLSFEAGDGNGANAVSDATGLGAFEGASVEIANVPALGGHTGKGAKFTKSKAGKQYSGFKVVYGADAFRYTTGANSVITFDYYAPVASPVQVKLETASGDSVMLTKAANVGWNSLSFDMSTAVGWSANVAFNLVAIFPDFSDDAAFTSSIVAANDQVFYLDNISINGGTLSDVGTQPTPSASPSSSPSAPGVTCNPGTPAIRLLAPLTSEMNFTPTGYDGVWQYIDPGTIVGTHYFPLRSTVAVKYQALDAECKAVAAGTKVYLAVNAAYSRAKTRFLNTYLGAVNLIEPIPADCAADQYCGEGQTVLEQTTDDKGQVTFVLTNLNPISPQAKPLSQLTLPSGTLLMQSVFSPSFSNYRVDPITGKSSGAGASNLDNHESIDVIWPSFANGMGSVSQPNDAIVAPGTNKTLVYVIRDNVGNPVPNAAVTITTDDGGSLVTPSSASVSADMNGFKTVSATADSQGRVTVVAKSTKKSTQSILVTYSGFVSSDPAVVGTNGYNTLTWGIAQSVASIKPNSFAKGKSIVLPAKSNKNLAIRWSTSTKTICKVSSTGGVTKVTALKKGICTVTATNAGKGMILKLARSANLTVK